MPHVIGCVFSTVFSVDTATALAVRLDKAIEDMEAGSIADVRVITKGLAGGIIAMAFHRAPNATDQWRESVLLIRIFDDGTIGEGIMQPSVDTVRCWSAEFGQEPPNVVLPARASTLK